MKLQITTQVIKLVILLLVEPSLITPNTAVFRDNTSDKPNDGRHMMLTGIIQLISFWTLCTRPDLNANIQADQRSRPMHSAERYDNCLLYTSDAADE